VRHIAILLLAGLSLAPASCTSASIDAGYLDLELSGDIGFARGSTNVSGRASIDQGLGQGGSTGAPFGRVELANDDGLFGYGMSVSGFLYDNQGTGILTASYGNISAGTPVRSDFNIINAKVGFFLSFDIAGVVFIRPGIAADMFLPDMEVATTTLTPTITETIDDPGGVPLPFVQVGFDAGIVSGFVEVGYLPLDTEDLNLGSEYDVESETLDIEAMVKVRPASHIELFAGYRLFQLDLEGRLSQDTVDIDIDLAGFMVGGGVYW
jgi:hypothetical protein